MSPTQSAWRSLPAKDEPSLSDPLLYVQMVDPCRSIGITVLIPAAPVVVAQTVAQTLETPSVTRRPPSRKLVLAVAVACTKQLVLTHAVQNLVLPCRWP